MHVLVIGGTRFVGALLVWRLLAGGHRVTVLNRGRNADAFGARIERLRADRSTGAFAEALAGRRFDATVDFAAFRAADVEGVLAVLGAAAGHYVLISSGQVYLVRAGAPRPAREIDYEGPPLPRPGDAGDRGEWEYGMGKRECEDALAEAWQRSGFASTRLRIPMVNGERDYHRRIEAYLWRLLDGGALLLPDGGLEPVRHVYGSEVARAIAGLLGREDTYGQAYNLAQEEAPALLRLVELLAAELGARPDLRAVPAAALRAADLEPALVSPFSTPWMSLLDPGRARDELGFRHLRLEEYLGRIVASFLAHPPLERPRGYELRSRELELAVP